MTVRFYLIPLIVPAPLLDREVKYMDALAIGPECHIDYGVHPVALVRIDVTAQQHSDLSANADVLSLPVNIDANLTAGAVTTTKTALETLNIPSGWVSTALTYRQVLSNVLRIFQLAKRISVGDLTKLVPDGFTLDNLVGDLPQGWRTALANKANAFGLDTSAVTLSTPLRTAIKNLADQWVGGISMGDHNGTTSL